MRVSIPVGLVLLIGLTSGLSAQSKPDFSGEWTLIADKSDFGRMVTAPARMTRRIVHKDPTLTIVTTQGGGATGDRKFEATYSTDEKPQTNVVNGNTMTTAGKWDKGAILLSSIVATQGMQIPVEERYELSDGGRTLTVTRRIQAPDGIETTHIVMARQPATK